MTELIEFVNIVTKINNINIIEDQYHFIFMCPLYTAERLFYIQRYFSHPSEGAFIDFFFFK